MKRYLALFLVMLVACPTLANAVTRANTQAYSTAGITLNLTHPAGSIYRPGEEIRFTFTTESDAYVIIFDIDPDGFVHLLYPSNGSVGKMAVAGKTYMVPPGEMTNFYVSGSTGMELVYALAVTDRDKIKEEELAFLLESEYADKDKMLRIDGDPMLAANMIASQLIRDISRSDVSIAYTYFHVNEEVDYPRYICAECHEDRTDPYVRPCDVYEVASDFRQTSNLSYPLTRGFTIAIAAEGESYEGDPPTAVHVTFYPYHSRVYSPVVWHYWNYYDPCYWSPLWYDPWYDWYPYYPSYCRSGFWFSFGWGWNYGCWDVGFGWGWGWGWGGGWGWGWPGYYYPPCVQPLYCYPYDYRYRSMRPGYTYRERSTLYRATIKNKSRNPDLNIGSVRYKQRKDIAYKNPSKTARRITSKDYQRNKSHVYNTRADKYANQRYGTKQGISRDTGSKSSSQSSKSIRGSKSRTSGDKRINKSPAKDKSKRVYRSPSSRSTSKPKAGKSYNRTAPRKSSSKAVKGRSGGSRGSSKSSAPRSGSSRSSSGRSGGGKSKRR